MMDQNPIPRGSASAMEEAMDAARYAPPYRPIPAAADANNLPGRRWHLPAELLDAASGAGGAAEIDAGWRRAALHGTLTATGSCVQPQPAQVPQVPSALPNETETDLGDDDEDEDELRGSRQAEAAAAAAAEAAEANRDAHLLADTREARLLPVARVCPIKLATNGRPLDDLSLAGWPPADKQQGARQQDGDQDQRLEAHLELLAERYLNASDKLNLSFYLNEYETNACDLSELLANLIQNSLAKLPSPLIKYKLLSYIKQLYIDAGSGRDRAQSVDSSAGGRRRQTQISTQDGEDEAKNPQLDLLLFDAMIHQYLIASNALIAAPPERADIELRRRRNRQRRASELAKQRQARDAGFGRAARREASPRGRPGESRPQRQLRNLGWAPAETGGGGGGCIRPAGGQQRRRPLDCCCCEGEFDQVAGDEDGRHQVAVTSSSSLSARRAPLVHASAALPLSPSPSPSSPASVAPYSLARPFSSAFDEPEFSGSAEEDNDKPANPQATTINVGQPRPAPMELPLRVMSGGGGGGCGIGAWPERSLLSSPMAALAIDGGAATSLQRRPQQPAPSNQNIYLPPAVSPALFAGQQPHPNRPPHQQQRRPIVLAGARPRSADCSPPPPPIAFEHEASQCFAPHCSGAPPPPRPLEDFPWTRPDASWPAGASRVEFPAGRAQFCGSGQANFDALDLGGATRQPQVVSSDDDQEPVTTSNFDYRPLVNEMPAAFLGGGSSQAWGAVGAANQPSCDAKYLQMAASSESSASTASELQQWAAGGGGQLKQICQCDQCAHRRRNGCASEASQAAVSEPPSSGHQPDQKRWLGQFSRRGEAPHWPPDYSWHPSQPSSPFETPRGGQLFSQRSASAHNQAWQPAPVRFQPDGLSGMEAPHFSQPLGQRCFSSMSVPYGDGEGQQAAMMTTMTPSAAAGCSQRPLQLHEHQQQNQPFVNAPPAGCRESGAPRAPASPPPPSQPASLGPRQQQQQWQAGQLQSTHSSLPSSPLEHRHRSHARQSHSRRHHHLRPPAGDGRARDGSQDFPGQRRRHHQSIQLKDWPAGQPAAQLLSAGSARRLRGAAPAMAAAAAARSATISDERAAACSGFQEDTEDEEEEEEEEDDDEFSGDECALVPLQAKGKLPLSVAEQMERQASRFVHQYGSAALAGRSRTTRPPAGGGQAAKHSAARTTTAAASARKPNLLVRRTLRVKIKKSKPILGIAIEGGFNVSGQLLPRVVCVHEDGAAYQCGKLRASDLILEVNGNSTVNMTHDQIAKTIATAYYQDPRPYIEFLIGESVQA